MIIRGVASFKNKHRGQKCFMIGAGPSLTYDMLDQLTSRYTFAMNNISVAYSYTEWRPTYYSNFQVASMRYKHNRECTQESLREAGHSFLWPDNMSLLFDMEHDDISASILSCHRFPQWTDRTCSWVSKFGTSMFPAMQLAVYMGFSTLYLLGCDLGYLKDFDLETLLDSSHFDPDYLSYERKVDRCDSVMEILADECKTYIAHQLAFLATARRGVTVKTCSEMLNEIYPYISFEEALGD